MGTVKTDSSPEQLLVRRHPLTLGTEPIGHLRSVMYSFGSPGPRLSEYDAGHENPPTSRINPTWSRYETIEGFPSEKEEAAILCASEGQRQNHTPTKAGFFDTTIVPGRTKGKGGTIELNVQVRKRLCCTTTEREAVQQLYFTKP